MTALLTADEAARLRVGVNVIVRPGWQPFAIGDVLPEIVAPQDWVALTGPCPNCGGWAKEKAIRCSNPDCRDGRRIVPLYRECPYPATAANPHGGYTHTGVPRGCDERGRVLAGRGSIEVVPVIATGTAGPNYVPGTALIVAPSGVFIERPTEARNWYFDLDPLPVPGRDFGIVIDVTELT